MKRLLCFVSAVVLAGYGWCYFEKEGIHADAIPTPHEYVRFVQGNYYTSLAELVIHIIDYEISLLLRFVQDKTASAVELVTEIIQAMD